MDGRLLDLGCTCEITPHPGTYEFETERKYLTACHISHNILALHKSTKDSVLPRYQQNYHGKIKNDFSKS